MNGAPSPADIRAALDAGQGPHAVRMGREVVGAFSVDDMLDVSSAFADHASYGPLVDLWRRRLKDRAPQPRETAAFANALNGLAVEHMAERREAEAMELLSEALKVEPELHFVRRNIAGLLIHQGNYAAAMLELDTLLAASENDPQANLLLGMAHYRAGDPALAIAPLRVAFLARIADAGLLLAKANCLLDKLDEARAVIQKLAWDHPERGTYMLKLEYDDPGSPLQRLRSS